MCGLVTVECGLRLRSVWGTEIQKFEWYSVFVLLFHFFLYLLQFLSELYLCHINNLVYFLHCVTVEKFCFQPPEPPPPAHSFYVLCILVLVLKKQDRQSRCIEQSACWEAESFSAIQQIPRNLYNPQIQRRVCKMCLVRIWRLSWRLCIYLKNWLDMHCM
jgi:hypothetical protein